MRKKVQNKSLAYNKQIFGQSKISAYSLRILSLGRGSGKTGLDRGAKELSTVLFEPWSKSQMTQNLSPRKKDPILEVHVLFAMHCPLIS